MPFYLQKTIGGSDIDNQPTLRAFKDYRFRGPDLMTVQAEYDRKLCQACAVCKEGILRSVCLHLGLVVAYDAGRVAVQRAIWIFPTCGKALGAVWPFTLART